MSSDNEASVIQQQIQWGHRTATWVAIGFGVGKIPTAPGTFGTLIGIPLYLLLTLFPTFIYGAIIVALFLFGIWICQIAEEHLGQSDHAAIVWDEIVGFLITMFLAPDGWRWIVIGFVLFRIFDIWKPFPIRRLDNLHGGFGVMADDVLAGVYACVVMQTLVWLGAY